MKGRAAGRVWGLSPAASGGTYWAEVFAGFLIGVIGLIGFIWGYRAYRGYRASFFWGFGVIGVIGFKVSGLGLCFWDLIEVTTKRKLCYLL